jgi:hypothetical protein
MPPLPYYDLSSLGKVLLIAKYVGTIGVAVGVLYGGVSWLASIFKKVTNISSNVQLVMDNHIPHLQQSLNSQDIALAAIKSDIRNLSTNVDAHSEKLNQTTDSLNELHQSFVDHLENAMKESSPRKRKRVS